MTETNKFKHLIFARQPQHDRIDNKQKRGTFLIFGFNQIILDFIKDIKKKEFIILNHQHSELTDGLSVSRPSAKYSIFSS